MKTTPPFTVVYEDEHIIAVNKASGISVGGDRWDDSKERLDKLIAEIAKPSAKIFTVHRIDRETSGLVVFAKNEETHRNLSLSFESRNVKKRYIAIVHGRPSWKEMVCDLPLIPNGNKQHKTIIDKYRGKKSITRFALAGSAGNFSIFEVFPETGRTHQIRVHAAALGFPIVCDSLYATDKPVLLSAIKKNWRGDLLDEKPLLERLGLHAVELSLPIAAASDESANNQNILTIQAPVPRDIAALIKQLKKSTTSVFAFGI
ncbi:MAG: RluA family pseudouridine synthase [Treponema sp.]|jgi:23S rRNA pseudouridine1911/1915/1917 synthase|nr:RluA family pseudouridine synthase [Treponema sp.]